MAPMFAELPGDVLATIASYINGPQIIVSVAADDDARVAVRRGVDVAERAQHGVTIREAETSLLLKYRLPAAVLSDRHAAGLALAEAAAGYEFDSNIIPTLLAYRAVPDVQTSSTIDGVVHVAGTALHFVSGSGHKRSLLFASLLLDAGACVNAECYYDHVAPGGTTALAWALKEDYELDENGELTIYCEPLDSVLSRFRVAKLPVERGAEIDLDTNFLRSALYLTVEYVSSVFELSLQVWNGVEEDVRRAHLATMPDCTEELSELYYFIADRLEASLAAAFAANAASGVDAEVAIAVARIEECRRRARAKELAEACASRVLDTELKNARRDMLEMNFESGRIQGRLEGLHEGQVAAWKEGCREGYRRGLLAAGFTVLVPGLLSMLVQHEEITGKTRIWLLPFILLFAIATLYGVLEKSKYI